MTEQTGEAQLPNPEYQRLSELGKRLEERINTVLPTIPDSDKTVVVETDTDNSRETITYSDETAGIYVKRTEVVYPGQKERKAVEMQMRITNEFPEEDKRLRRMITFSVWKGWENATEDEVKFPYELMIQVEEHDDNPETNSHAATHPWVLEEKKPPLTFQFSPVGDARIPLPDPNVVALYGGEKMPDDAFVNPQVTPSSKEEEAIIEAAQVRSLGGYLTTLLRDIEGVSRRYASDTIHDDVA